MPEFRRRITLGLARGWLAGLVYALVAYTLGAYPALGQSAESKEADSELRYRLAESCEAFESARGEHELGIFAPLHHALTIAKGERLEPSCEEIARSGIVAEFAAAFYSHLDVATPAELRHSVTGHAVVPTKDIPWFASREPGTEQPLTRALLLAAAANTSGALELSLSQRARPPTTTAASR
jgi:hypothetical protein